MTPMDFEGVVRQAIADWQAGYADADAGVLHGQFPVFYENGPQPDESRLSFWADVEFRYYGGGTNAVGVSAGNRHTGVVAVSVYIKLGEGSQAPRRALRDLTRLLSVRRWGDGAATLGYEMMTPPPDFFGWYKTGAMVYFRLDEEGRG